MIDTNKVGNNWQNIVKCKLEKLNLVVKLLDTKGHSNNRCIDFYVYKRNSYQDGFLCEVKSVNVAGFDSDIKAYISSQDINFSNAISGESFGNINNGKKKHEYDYDYNSVLDRIEERLKDAVDQHNKSNLDIFDIDKGSRPFTVALCFDFVIFLDQVNFEQLLQSLPSISAVLTLQSMQNDAEIKIYRNKSAKIAFEENFLVKRGALFIVLHFLIQLALSCLLKLKGLVRTVGFNK